jgi:hypothetical protein
MVKNVVSTKRIVKFWGKWNNFLFILLGKFAKFLIRQKLKIKNHKSFIMVPIPLGSCEGLIA